MSVLILILLFLLILLLLFFLLLLFILILIPATAGPPHKGNAQTQTTPHASSAYGVACQLTS
jgi:hypothetical protein